MVIRFSPLNFVELCVVLLHAGSDALDALSEDHVGLGRRGTAQTPLRTVRLSYAAGK